MPTDMMTVVGSASRSLRIMVLAMVLMVALG